MPKLSRTQIVGAVGAVLVLATLAVAAAAARDGEEQARFQVDSEEPSWAGTPAAGTGGEAPSSVVDPIPGPPPAPPARPVPPAGPDAPVSSEDTPRPEPHIVGDPPSAFSGIRTFEDCAAAGYPIAESYPEQCRTPDGRLFVRDIGR